MAEFKDLSDDEIFRLFHHDPSHGVMAVWEKYHTTMRRYLYRFFRYTGVSTDEVEDVIAESTFRILENVRKYNPKEVPTKRWYFAVVRRTAQQVAYRKAREYAKLKDGLPEPVELIPASSVNLPESELAQKEIYLYIWRCIDELPKIEREVIYETIRSNYAKDKDIAVNLGISQGKVITVRKQAVAHLRSNLKSIGIYPEPAGISTVDWRCFVETYDIPSRIDEELATQLELTFNAISRQSMELVNRVEMLAEQAESQRLCNDVSDSFSELSNKIQGIAERINRLSSTIENRIGT